MGVEQEAQKMNIRGAIITLIVSAFGFVAALFWRDAIKAFIDEVIPEGQGMGYQLMVAVIVTVMAVVIIFILTKYVASFSITESVKKAHSKIKKPAKKTGK